MKILIASPESAPFVSTGGLGDVTGSLPQALANLGNDVRVVIPKYQAIADKHKEGMTFLGNVYVSLGWRSQYCGVFEKDVNNVKYYFIDNEYYFSGENIYSDCDWERYAFFSKAVLEILPLIGFYPDIIQCNDWQTGLIPPFHHAFYRHHDSYKNIKTVFTIHNLKYQGVQNVSYVQDITGLPDWYFDNTRIGNGRTSLMKDNQDANYMKGGIVFADRVTTVSPTYAHEITTPQYGEDLDWLLSTKNVVGIINGTDLKPNNAKNIVNYSKRNFTTKKAENKEILQRKMALDIRPDVPMIGMVARLVHQKGFQLVNKIMDKLMERDVQVIILGTGEDYYESSLQYFEHKYHEKLRSCIMYDSALANQIFAASDMFLMPSLFEPCGISQLISMNFGTLPIARETGGLKDTVIPFNEYTGYGNGFSFAPFNAEDMLFTIDRALNFYQDPKTWKSIQQQAMNADNSWQHSAQKYIDTFEEILNA